MTSSENPPVNLLWTGGWDSTFRLLQLLLVEQRVVQPFYVIEPARKSTPFELKAMEDIQQRLCTCWPDARDRLKPTTQVELGSITKDDSISAGFQRLRQQLYVGSQYEWLARLAKTHREHPLEICMMRCEGADIDGKLMTYEPCTDGFQLSPELWGSDIGGVFRYFRFPIVHLTKRDMEDIAAENGFRDVLDLTWFCYHPRPDGRPCGCCRTCRVAVESKLGKRIPLASRLRYHVSIRPRLRDFVLRHHGLYIMGRKIKHLLGDRQLG